MTNHPPHNPSGYDPRDPIEWGFNQAARVILVMSDQSLPDWQRREQIEAILGIGQVHPAVVDLLAGLGMQSVLLADRLCQYEPVVLVGNLRIDLEEAARGDQQG